MASTPSTQRVLALMSKLLCVPTSESLLAQFHLVTVGLFTFLLDLSIIGVAFTSTSSSLTDAREDDCSEEEGSSGAATSVYGQLGGLGKGGELLSERKVRNFRCGDGLCNC